MAPRTRTRNTKVLKENIDVVRKTKVKNVGKVTKAPRKALADKTNSLSDDNASIDIPVKTSEVALKSKTLNKSDNEVKPRRERRLPNRFVDNVILNNLCNSKDDTKSVSPVISIPDTSSVNPSKIAKKSTIVPQDVKLVSKPRRNGRLQSVKEPPPSKKSETPNKVSQTVSSPFKTPSQSLDSSLGLNRPKRISRLPSKFEDHSISPNKLIPLLPCHASTPLIQKNKIKKAKPNPEKILTRRNRDVIKENQKSSKGIENYFQKVDKSKKPETSVNTSNISKKTSPDTNNNKGSKKVLKKVVSSKSPIKQPSPKTTSNKIGFAKRLLNKSLSFRVFEDRKADNNDEDIYEFTFDPNEEPKPQKKKRKRPTQKKTAKPKMVVFKNNYDKNVEKALESLKSKVKPSQTQNVQKNLSQPEKTQVQKQTQKPPTIVTNKKAKIQILENIVTQPASENQPASNTPAQPTNESVKSIHMSNYASINVDDIAADFASDTNDLNYSPVYSPCNKTPRHPGNAANDSQVAINHKDPLNLQGNGSFFDEQPVASSSMNVSVRHPLASPWRVEFNNLPIKWQANTYVKSNMTPAVESSFITSEELSKKKHVYTNMVENPSQVFEDPPALKQTSIISFMKEVAERSLKKKRGRSVSPTKANSLFDHTAGDTFNFGYKTPKKARKEPLATPNVSNTSKDKSSDKENSNHIEDHENVNEVLNENSNPKDNSNHSDKSPTKKSKKKDKDGTLFGFDESENDQENVSPIKNARQTRHRGLRAKSRILQDVNTLSGPTRAVLPKPKLASSDVVEKLYDQLKSAEVAPLFPQKTGANVNAITDEACLSDEDGQSVHLFEDIELVHHLKPQRKSYGKPQKVTFRQNSIESDTYTEVPETRSSDEDNLDDLSFHLPNVKQKKVTKKRKPKKQMSKKEEKEAEAWAAGFNSMCEDIDDFALVVE